MASPRKFRSVGKTIWSVAQNSSLTVFARSASLLRGNLAHIQNSIGFKGRLQETPGLGQHGC